MLSPSYVLKMAAAGPSETLVTAYQTTRPHVPEVNDLHSQSTLQLDFCN
jgi:hypothetical protein